MKRVVISGATGAIGMALIQKCIDENVGVIVLLRPDSARRDRIPKNPLVTILDYDLCDYEKITCEDIEKSLAIESAQEPGVDCAGRSLSASLKNSERDCSDRDDAPEVFYHFAWAGTFGDCRNDMQLQAQNAMYAMSAASLAKRMGCKAFIGAGSQAEYGRVEGVLTPDTPTNPENGYGIYKLQAGQMTRQLCAELGMVHVWTRILSVYGPYDGKDTMVSATIRKMINGEVPDFTPAEQVWDYLYSSDAANAMYLLGKASLGEMQDYATEIDVNGKTYVIGSGIGKPLYEYIETIRDVVNPNCELGIGRLPYRDKQVMHLVADISELQRDTGFTAQVDFAEGIRRTCEYLKEN